MPTSRFDVSIKTTPTALLKEEQTVQYGIHNDTLTTELTDERFVSLSWDIIGDLTQIPGARNELKAELARVPKNVTK